MKHVLILTFSFLLLISMPSLAQTTWTENATGNTLTPTTQTRMVGIGVVPTERLSVNGNIKVGLGNMIGVFPTATSERFTYDGVTVGQYSLGWHSDPSSPTNHRGYLSGYAGLRFFTASSLRLSITKAGNVGIGTDTPSDKFEVVGGRVSVRENTTSTSNALLINPANFNGQSFTSIQAHKFGTGGQILALNPSGGNVGVGTGTPTERFSVNGNIKVEVNNMIGLLPTATSERFTHDGLTIGRYSLGWYTKTPGAAAPLGYLSGYGGLRFFTQDQIRLAITTAGNVGIGNDTPAEKLDVAGAVVLGSGSVNANTTKLFIKNPHVSGKTWAISSGANGLNEHAFSIYNWTKYKDITTKIPYFSIGESGNVTIGEAIPTGEKFEVAGTNQRISINDGGGASRQALLLQPPNYTGQGSTTIIPYSKIQTYDYASTSTKPYPDLAINPDGGNVGFGTSTPTEKLSVNGNIKVEINKMIGLLPTATSERFTHDDLTIGRYSLGWYTKTPGAAAPLGYLSGYAGLRFFTQDQLRLAITTAGNVGIGTDAPSSKLEIKATTIAQHELLKLNASGVGAQGYLIRDVNKGYFWDHWNNNGVNDFKLKYDAINGDPYLSYSSTGFNDILAIKRSGNVGIGTLTPTEKLSVTGNIKVELGNMIGMFPTATSERFQYEGVTVGQYSLGWHTSPTNPNAHSGYLSGYAGLKFFTGTNLRLAIDVQGRINMPGILEIGSNGTAATGYKLNVWGKIRANEIVVNTDGADFVFEDDYQLMPLSEVESFIKANKHLPEIPSASQMQEEGMGVSELQTKLLQKVEELTLYMIEIKKENELLKAEISKLKK